MHALRQNAALVRVITACSRAEEHSVMYMYGEECIYVRAACDRQVRKGERPHRAVMNPIPLSRASLRFLVKQTHHAARGAGDSAALFLFHLQTLHESALQRPRVEVLHKCDREAALAPGAGIRCSEVA